MRRVAGQVGQKCAVGRWQLEVGLLVCGIRKGGFIDGLGGWGILIWQGRLNTHFLDCVALLLVLVAIGMYGCCALQRVASRKGSKASHGE